MAHEHVSVRKQGAGHHLLDGNGVAVADGVREGVADGMGTVVGQGEGVLAGDGGTVATVGGGGDVGGDLVGRIAVMRGRVEELLSTVGESEETDDLLTEVYGLEAELRRSAVVGEPTVIGIRAIDFADAKRQADAYENEYGVRLRYSCTDGFVPDAMFEFVTVTLEDTGFLRECKRGWGFVQV